MRESLEGHDFFISYTAVDELWAVWIAVQLEQAGYTTVSQALDFRPGHDFVHAMHQASATAVRTIVVLSPAYLQSKLGEAEWRVAFAKDPTGERQLLIPVRVQPVTPPGLLSTRIAIDLMDLDEVTARQTLLDTVGPSSPRPSAAAFPGSSPTLSSGDETRGARFPGGRPTDANQRPTAQATSDPDPINLLVEINVELKATNSRSTKWPLTRDGAKNFPSYRYVQRAVEDLQTAWNRTVRSVMQDANASFAHRLARRAQYEFSDTHYEKDGRRLAELVGDARWITLGRNVQRLVREGFSIRPIPPQSVGPRSPKSPGRTALVPTAESAEAFVAAARLTVHQMYSLLDQERK